MKSYVLFNIRMKTEGNRACPGSSPQDLFYFIRVVIRRKGQFDLYFTDPSGIGGHDLGDLGRGAVDIELMGLCCNAHDGEHAISEGGGHKIRRGKGFSLAHVIHWRIGDDVLLRPHMD